MEVTQQQAYEAALTIIGRMTVEQHFQRMVMDEQSSELSRLKDSEGSDS